MYALRFSWQLGLILPILIFTSTCQREPSLFPQINLSKPTLVYVLRETECVSCVTRLQSFVETMATGEHQLDQILLIVSSTKSDSRDFGTSLGLPTFFASSAQFLKGTGTLHFLPMMYLLNRKKEIIFARPASFIGHDLEYMKEEIIQLYFEFRET